MLFSFAIKNMKLLFFFKCFSVVFDDYDRVDWVVLLIACGFARKMSIGDSRIDEYWKFELLQVDDLIRKFGFPE